ncbi:hypothetical protein RchiOBHm_Chr2g0132991 [Rosa chinensis]|uniref:Uncharacterized protein n=1 Tax=Rosa chinensis TaxID=74649 RepID=A0A2P6RVG0_ROSCH|nr:hypothetical protein RchiOBHm_Chr2g0132991 [Rosa chinensis]
MSKLPSSPLSSSPKSHNRDVNKKMKNHQLLYLQQGSTVYFSVMKSHYLGN